MRTTPSSSCPDSRSASGTFCALNVWWMIVSARPAGVSGARRGAQHGGARRRTHRTSPAGRCRQSASCAAWRRWPSVPQSRWCLAGPAWPRCIASKTSRRRVQNARHGGRETRRRLPLRRCCEQTGAAGHRARRRALLWSCTGLKSWCCWTRWRRCAPACPGALLGDSCRLRNLSLESNRLEVGWFGFGRQAVTLNPVGSRRIRPAPTGPAGADRSRPVPTGSGRIGHPAPSPV